MSTKKFHNSVLRGPAYVNDLRLVKPKGSRGDGYLSARVRVLQGEKRSSEESGQQGGADEHLLVNCNLQGDAAKMMEPYVGSSAPIWAVVRISNLSSEIYIRSSDSPYGKKGTPAIATSGRLYAIEQLYVDGKKVYSKADEQAQADAQAERQADQDAPRRQAVGASQVPSDPFGDDEPF